MRRVLPHDKPVMVHFFQNLEGEILLEGEEQGNIRASANKAAGPGAAAGASSSSSSSKPAPAKDIDLKNKKKGDKEEYLRT